MIVDGRVRDMVRCVRLVRLAGCTGNMVGQFLSNGL